MVLVLEHVPDARGVRQVHDRVQELEREFEQDLLLVLVQRGVVADPDANAEGHHERLLKVQLGNADELVLLVSNQQVLHLSK